MSPNTHHSNPTVSARSGLSQVTLVEKHLDQATINEMKPDGGFRVLSHSMPKYTWLDHLLGIFCVKSSKNTQTYNESFVQSKIFESSEVIQNVSCPAPFCAVVMTVMSQINFNSTSILNAMSFHMDPASCLAMANQYSP